MSLQSHIMDNNNNNNNNMSNNNNMRYRRGLLGRSLDDSTNPASAPTSGPVEEKVTPQERGLSAVWWFAPQFIDYARFVLVLPLVLLQPTRDEGSTRFLCAAAYCLSHLLDFVDGRVARAYNQCSHLGILLDHTLDIFTTVFMAAILVSEHPQLLNHILLDSASYVIVVMLLINRTIQTCRLRDAHPDGNTSLSDGVMGKWNVPGCVQGGTFLNGGHFLFMFHQIWLAMLYIDSENFAPLLRIPSAPGMGYHAFIMGTVAALLVAYYTMVAAICFVCLATYSEPNPAAKTPRRTVITFGTYDLFHYGHLRILERSAARGDRLVVGISSDQLNWNKKQQVPAIGQEQRMAIVKALGFVDEVFFEESLELKKHYCEKYRADVLVMGDDHLNEYNEMLEGVCECEYLARTAGVSSTMIKKHLSGDASSSPSSSDTEDSDYTSSSMEKPELRSHRITD